MSKRQIGTLVIIVVFALLVGPVIFKRLRDSAVVDGKRLDQVSTHRTAEQLQIMGKAPDFVFTDQHGTKVSNADFKGQVYLVEFFFSSCPSICPKMNAHMKQVSEHFFGNPHLSIASISIDPETDTPEVLQAYAKRLGARSSQWHFLTGDYDVTMELANKGFNVYAGKNDKVAGGFEHSGLVALVDQKGNIRCRKDAYGNPILYYDGLEQRGVQDLMADIQLLLNE